MNPSREVGATDESGPPVSGPAHRRRPPAEPETVMDRTLFERFGLLLHL